MASAPSKLELLQHIVKNLHAEPWKKSGPINESDIRALHLMTGKIGPNGIAGIRMEAAEGVTQMADAIFSGTRYERGTTFAAVRGKMTDTVIINYADKPQSVVSAADVAFVEKEIADWYNAQIATHEFYIPCYVTPWPNSAFTVGPVHFVHVAEFAEAVRANSEAIFEFTFGPMLESMGRSAAGWVATVSVADCTKDRAQEIADLAVDIALGGLQLSLPEDDARHMSRMTGRTMPVFSHAVSRSAGNVSSGSTNSEPGRSFGPGFLDQRLRETQRLIGSVGHRLTAYVTGHATLRELEQAWADAAYWFHEGLAEPLDTIAVPKLETSIEVLLRSESTKGSKARVIKAIEAVYGLKRSDFINPNSQTTVEQFAQGFVTDRSRILHGTWSTLNHSLRASRPSLTMLVRHLLASYSLILDTYVAEASSTDEIDAFLSYMDQQRQAQAAAAGVKTV
jgi:hypothetical protein